MSSVPRDVGPIEGREVHRDAPAPSRAPASPPPAAPAAPASPPPGAAPPSSGVPPAFRPPANPPNLPVPRDGPRSPAHAWREVRRNRGRDVPNSRPLPLWVKRFSWVLDDAFAVPGLPGRRVGVDGLISLVPVAGDMVGIGLSLIIVMVGIGAGVTVPTVLRMLLYIGLEALVGLIPVGGTVFNMAFKANNRNVALIEADLADRRRTRRSSLGVLVLSLAVLFIGMLMLIALFVASIAVLVWLLSRVF